MMCLGVVYLMLPILLGCPELLGSENQLFSQNLRLLVPVYFQILFMSHYLFPPFLRQQITHMLDP